MSLSDETSAPSDGTPAADSWWARSLASFSQFAKSDNGSLIGAAAVLTFLSAVFGTLARHLTYSYVNDDERAFVWTGWAINRGLVPYRDFSDFKPPLVFLTNAIALRFFGVEQQAYRSFFTGFATLSFLALILALLSLGVNKFVVTAFGLFICHLWLQTWFHDSSFDDAESIGLAYFFFGVACFLARTRARAVTDFLGGVLLSLAVLSKEPYGLAAIPTWAAFLSMRSAEEESPRAWRRFALFSLSGVALVAVWLVGYFGVHGALGVYATTVMRYATMGKKVCVAAGLWQPGTFLEEWSVRLRHLSEELVNFVQLGAALPFLIAPFALGDRRDRRTTLSAAIAVLGSLYAVTLGGCFYNHYYILGMAGLFVWMILGALRLSAGMAALSPRLAIYAGVFIVLLPGWAIWPRIAVARETEFVVNPPPESPDLVAYIRANTTPDDAIFTTGLPSLYTQANRKHATREGIYNDLFIDLYDGETDRERASGYYQELVQSRPKLIIVDQKSPQLRPRYDAALWTPFIQEFGYRRVEDFGGFYITDVIYVRPD
jgi:hypothetical protein